MTTIQLSGVKNNPNRTYTMEIPSHGTPGCPMQAVYHNKTCGSPANFKMANDLHTVDVCGIHVRSLIARGWNKVNEERRVYEDR